MSNYNCIQTKFMQWSNKRALHPNAAYKKNIKTIKSLSIPLAILLLSIVFGPLVSAFNDIGKLPLDNRAHFVLFWPKIVDTNKLSMYGIIYTLQIIFTICLFISVLSFNLGFMVFLNELNTQFEMLLDGINDAFKYKMNKQFSTLFIDCIRHHQIIIKFLDDLKSYFKWMILIEIVVVQVILAILIYNLTKVNASFGYKVKIGGSLLFNLLPICFHCHIGEVVLSLHKRLSNHIYNMTWYDMPNKNKQLIVIMFQRTQRDLTLSSALFSSEKASRSLISKVIKQVYTILNVLLKTGIDSEFNITEEIASLVPLKDTKKASNLFEAVETTLNTFSVNLVNISGLTTDDAPGRLAITFEKLFTVDAEDIGIDPSALCKSQIILDKHFKGYI
ncbi:hypothetical protein QTP88_013881 [Uroleucon formosanum]